MRGSSERRHRREGLGTCIEREKIGGRKRFGEQISQSGKDAAAGNQAIGEENV